MNNDYDVHLTSSGAPNGIGEYHWEHPDSVVAVPNELAQQLLRISGGGYAQVEPYKALPVPRDLVPKVSAPSLVEQLTEAPPPVAVAGDPSDVNSLGEALDLVDNKPKRGRPKKGA